MPYVIGRPPKRVLALVATTVGMLITASPALADGGSTVPTVAATPSSPVASCPGVSAAQDLSSLGDYNFYAPVSGGTFEGSTAGWTFNNASVVSGNEPWNVVSSSDSNSLNIGPGGSATSPTFCVDSTFPSFRFFAQSQSNSYNWRGGLNVSAIWTLSNGMSGQTGITYLSPGNYTSWEPTQSLPLGSQLPLGQTATVQFVFSTGWGGNWNIDDVLLDPYAK